MSGKRPPPSGQCTVKTICLRWMSSLVICSDPLLRLISWPWRCWQTVNVGQSCTPCIFPFFASLKILPTGAWLAWQPGYRLRAYRGRGRREVSCCKVQSVNCRDWTLTVLCSWEEWGCSSICKQGQRRATAAAEAAAARWRAACFRGE